MRGERPCAVVCACCVTSVCVACVSVFVPVSYQLIVHTVLHAISIISVWTAIRQLRVRAIRFQSRPSMWLSRGGAGAPWGNVIIPCWLLSAGFSALSVWRDSSLRPLLISNSMPLKLSYMSEICIKSQI